MRGNLCNKDYYLDILYNVGMYVVHRKHATIFESYTAKNMLFIMRVTP